MSDIWKDWLDARFAEVHVGRVENNLGGVFLHMEAGLGQYRSLP